MDLGDCVLVSYRSYNESGFYRLVNRSTIPQLDMTKPALKLLKFTEADYYRLVIRLPSKDGESFDVTYSIRFNEHNNWIEVLLMAFSNEHREEIPADLSDKLVSSIFLDAYPIIKPMLLQKCVETWVPNLFVRYDDFMNNYNNRVINNAARTIQNKWQEARLNPYCRLGFNTINRQYDEYFNK